MPSFAISWDVLPVVLPQLAAPARHYVEKEAEAGEDLCLTAYLPEVLV